MSFLANNGRYAEAYALIETRAAAIMSSAPEEQAQAFAASIREVQQDPAYDNAGRWTSDPAVARRWPALALQLHRIEKARFDWGNNYRDALLQLIDGRWREYSDITYDISGHYSQITNWARAELARLLKSDPSVPETAAQMALPLSIFMRWLSEPDDEDLAIAKGLLCSGPEVRATVIRAWGDHGGFQGVETFARMAASPALTAADRQALAAATDRYAERRQRSENPWESEEKWLPLFKLSRPFTPDELGDIRPLSCPA